MLPLSLELKAVAVLLALAGVLGGWLWVRHHYRAEGAAEVRAEWAAAAVKANEANRAEEQRRAAAQQEVSHVAQQAQARVAADRRAADSAADGLRGRTVSVAARCQAPGDPAASGPGAAASSPGNLLADMLGRLDQAAGELAAAADSARIAGFACQQSYDALTK